MKNLLITIYVLLLIGCAVDGSLKPEVTERGEAREPCPFVSGTIISSKDIMIEGPVETYQSGGAAIGGYIGNRATKDKGDIEEAVGTLVGAGVGHSVGNAIGKSTAKPGVLLFIELGSGAGVSVSQEAGKFNFEKGDKVILSGHLKSSSYHQTCPLRVFPQE
tara:strand:+ start:847 stop:1332 length:486 start_codon:yes stop_codon:yes gene_type:complete